MTTTNSGQKGAGLNILAESGMLLVADKPTGLTIEEIAERLKDQFPELAHLGKERRYGIAHRLDKDTSGVLAVAKTPDAFERLQKQFAQRQVEKRYICLVEGGPKQEAGTIHTLLARSPADRRKQRTYPLPETKEGRPFEFPQGKREAITEWKVLERFQGYVLLEVIPKTGRKHQIRVHMASMGNPIAGDKLYGFKNQQTPKGLTRQFLHASYLKIQGQEFTSKLPEDLQQVLQTLQPYDS